MARCRNRQSPATVIDSASGPQRIARSVSKNCGKSPRTNFRRGLFGILSVGLCQKARAGAHFSIITVTGWFRLDLWSTSTYENPTLSPFDEFQRFKTHPLIRGTFAGGKRIAYGARVIASGGWQSTPKLVFPGGALIGCSAGFVNFSRIKGSHNAILSGILAAEKASEALAARAGERRTERLRDSWRDSDIGRDLYKVRNVKPLWSRFGLLGVGLGGFDMWTNEFFETSIFGTLKHGKPDSDALEANIRGHPHRLPEARRRINV